MNQEEQKEYLKKQDTESRINRVILGITTCFTALAMYALLILGTLSGDSPPSEVGIWLCIIISMIGVGLLIGATFVTDQDREGNL